MVKMCVAKMLIFENGMLPKSKIALQLQRFGLVKKKKIRKKNSSLLVFDKISRIVEPQDAQYYWLKFGDNFFQTIWNRLLTQAKYVYLKKSFFGTPFCTFFYLKPKVPFSLSNFVIMCSFHSLPKLYKLSNYVPLLSIQNLLNLYILYLLYVFQIHI